MTSSFSQDGKTKTRKPTSVHILTLMRYVHFTVFSWVWNRHSVQISVLCWGGWRHVPRISRRGLSTELQTYYSEIMWKWNLCTTMVHHNVGQGRTPASKPLWFPTIKSMSFCLDYWIVPTCIKQDCKERSNDCQPKFQNILLRLSESHSKLASLFDMLHGWKVSSRIRCGKGYMMAEHQRSETLDILQKKTDHHRRSRYIHDSHQRYKTNAQ